MENRYYAHRQGTALKKGLLATCVIAGFTAGSGDALAGRKLPGYYMLEEYRQKAAASRTAAASMTAALPPPVLQQAAATTHPAPLLPWLTEKPGSAPAALKKTHREETPAMPASISSLAEVITDPNDPRFVPPDFSRNRGEEATHALPVAALPVSRKPRELAWGSSSVPHSPRQHKPAPAPEAFIEPKAALRPGREANEDVFGQETDVVSNEELGNIRGGFVASSGMIIDVGLVTQTLVDGLSVEKNEITSDQFKHLKLSDLQTLVKVNPNGAAFQKLDLAHVPHIIRAVQNTRNDVTIDNLMTLNIEVKNVAAFNLQTDMANLNAQIVQGTLR